MKPLSPPPSLPKLSGVALKVVDAYVCWHEGLRHIPKMRRYSLGTRIDSLFATIIELVAFAQFSPPTQRADIITKAIARTDTLKFMLFVLLELKGIEDKPFYDLAQRVEEVGKMLYGWRSRT